MSPDDLTFLFERLEQWLVAHAPQIYAELTPGVEDSELDELEALTGQTLPPEFRALYRRHGDWGRALRMTHMPLMRIHRDWLMWESLSGEDFALLTEGHRSFPPGAITPRHINLGWIPFLTDHGGNAVGIDLAPAARGVRGQVITFGRDELVKYVLASSLRDFLNEYLERLEEGRVKVIAEDNLNFPPFHPTQRLELTDASGEGVDAYLHLADLFPDFGASPTR